MKYFNRKEYECRCGCGLDTVDYELDNVMDNIREHFNKPIIINRGISCIDHNKNVGGSVNSQHLIGKACDFVIAGVDSNLVADYLELKYHNKYGIGWYDGRTHIDVRKNKARWDNRTKV